MKITIKGAHVMVAGRFRGRTQADIKRLIQHAGGHITGSIDEAQLIVAGSRARGKVVEVKNRGLHVVGRDELEALFSTGAIEVEAIAPTGEAPAGEVVGELRLLFHSGHAAPGVETWRGPRMGRVRAS